MTYYDEILKTRDIKEPPFWRFNLTDKEFEELSETLKAGFLNNRYNLLYREACLLYASWWSRMYKGGKPSRERIAKDTGIGEKYSEQLYKLARKGFDRMSLTLYKSENNRRMYFESMLVQGGLPFFAIAEMKNNNNGFKNYLKALIDEYEDMNIVDWSDTSLVRSLARSYINNSIFEKSDMFYEFSLEIVKSYLNGDENFKGYDAIQSIISQIRTEKKKKTTRQNTLFRVIWQIRKSGPDINIGYSVRIPNEINAGDINKSAAGDENSKIVYFYINGRMIVSYYCHGDKFSRMPGSFGDEFFAWSPDAPEIRLQVKYENGNIADFRLMNSEPPSFDEPVVLQSKGDFWSFKYERNGIYYAVIYPEIWIPQCQTDAEKITFDGKIYMWCEMAADTDMTFLNAETGENVICDRRVSDYTASVIFSSEEWIESSSLPLLCNISSFLNSLVVFHNEESVSYKETEIMYSVNGERKLYKYISGLLPDGLINMKIMFPDKSSKNFRFFNITGINYDKADKTSFSLVYKKGKAELIKDGKRIVTKQGDLYRIENSEILTDLAPVKFRIYGPGILKSVDLNIKLPVDVNYFISRDFKILENNSTITIDDLYDYKFVTDGKSQKRGITISLFEVDAEGEHKEMAERRISGLRPGTYNLDFFKDTFMKFYSIFGFNDWKYYLRLKSGGRMINIVRHRFRSDQYDSPERNGVKITDKGTPVSGLTLSAIILNCNRSSELYGQIIGMKEDLNNEGVYHPDTESLKADDCGSSAFLVFSTEKNSLVRPYALYLYDELNVEQRNKLKRESIEKIGRLLRYEDCDPEEYEQEWHDVKLCTELAVDHNLPFTTFNCFFSIQSDPDLLAEFCYRALKFNIPNMNVDELIRFEYEMGVAFHCLPGSSWRRVAAMIGEEYDSNPFFKDVIEKDVFISERHKYFFDLLNLQFGDKGTAIGLKNIFDNDLAKFLFENAVAGKDFRYNDMTVYLAQMTDCTDGFERLYTPPHSGLSNMTLPYMPIKAGKNDNAIKKLQYYSLIMPQIAGELYKGESENLWSYDPVNLYKRRMINYVRRYAEDVYNEIFEITISKNI